MFRNAINSHYTLKRLQCTRLSSTLTEMDLVVIGGGPGGYVAAIKAAQMGLKVACIEKRGSLGGTCLNVGCIPSKALLHNSHLFHMAKHEFSERGIDVSSCDLNLNNMMKNKTKIVKSLTSGIEMLFKKNKIFYAKGHGRITEPGLVSVISSDNSKELTFKTKNIIIATGSEASSLPSIPFDEKYIISSTGALSLTTVPKSLVVVGAGVIGLELGSVWSRLGSNVTVIESQNIIGGGIMDKQIANSFQKLLMSRDNLKFELGAKLLSVERGSHVEISKNDDKRQKINADIVLVAVGRRPCTENLGLENVGIKLDGRGRINVNRETLSTEVSGIYAIGDVIIGPMLAHKAEEEGIAVVENIIKPKSGHVNYGAIPSVIYTHPEVAWVGLTEEEVIQTKEPYNIGIFPFLANSRAKTNGDTDGLVKIIAHKETDRILGAHIIGPNAGEMISEATLAIEYGASSEDIARTCHAHPTLSEAFKEACMAAYGNKKAIHF